LKVTNIFKARKISIHRNKTRIIQSIVFGLILFLSTVNTPLLAQNSRISGFVNTKSNQLLPYANVIILGTSVGASTNFDGEHTLPLTAGKHSISFQFVGYKTQIITMEVRAGEYKKLDITLAEEKLLLDMVVVRPNGENPAYSIIRGTQENKKKYLNENRDISFKAYTKLWEVYRE
jgi:hypothetical protein